MRRGVVDQLVQFVRQMLGRTGGASTPSGGDRPRGRRGRSGPAAGSDGARPAPGGPPPATDVTDHSMRVEYSPCLDGDPDPGEVVWTWVPYEDDPKQGKDRPVVIIGRRGAHLLGVPLTSKQHDNEAQVSVGTGPWDREGRESYAKLERLLDVDPASVRREGAVLDRSAFDDVVAGVRRVHHMP